MLQTYPSKVNERFTIKEDQWVVSIINTGGKFGGHAKIIVEGQKMDPPRTSPILFANEYHIMEVREAQEIGILDKIPQFMKNTRCQYLVLIGEKEEGCDIHFLSSFPEILDDFADSYILVDQELRYVKGEQNRKNHEYEIVVIDNFRKISSFLVGIDTNTFKQIRLSEQELNELIVHNGGHRREDKIRRANDKLKQYQSSSSTSWHIDPELARKMIRDINDEQHGEGKYHQNFNYEPNFQYFGKWCIYNYKGGHNCATWAEEKLQICGAGSGEIWSDSTKAIPELHANKISFWKIGVGLTVATVFAVVATRELSK